MVEWAETTWGAVSKLEYGKALRGYQNAVGDYPVYGTNGPIGQCDTPLVEIPGVIIGRKGAYRGVHYSDKSFFVIDTAFYLDPSEDVDALWAYYNLKTIDINSMDSGSAIPSTSRHDFYKLPLLLPPIEEQRRIAGLLRVLDDKIDLNRRMNETLEAMARALFKSWFVDFDPVHAKMEGRQPAHMDADTATLFPDALDADRLPQGWGERPVYDIANFVNGAAYKNMHFCARSDGLPVIKIVELKSGVKAETKFTNTDLGEKYRIDTGDVLFSWSGNPDTSIDVFIWDDGPAWLNQHIFAVRENGRASKAFVFFQLKQLMPTFAEIARNKQTTGLGHVTVRDMKELMVCDPPIEVADAFEATANPLFEKIFGTVLENQTLAELRDTLLPKLMSGEIRVREAEASINGNV